MKNTNLFPMHLNLQLFAEGSGGDGGTGADGTTGEIATAAVPQTKGDKTSLAEGATPAAEVNPTPTEDRNAKFEALIRGEYKDLFDARMQNTIQKRLKGTMETVDKYNALAPTLDILAKKYGVDASDVKALNKAIEEDDSYFEEEALQKGITVEQLKEIRKMERENAELKRQMEEHNRRENANKVYAQWMEQANQVKSVYPAFNLNTELQNPQFVNLLRSNIDVRTAFEVLHKDEIIPAAMQYTAKTVEQKLTNKVIANGARPAENGNSSQGATVTKFDPSNMTREQRAEINRKVLRGDKLTFK